jgi:predicted TIM-barrel fold metal-dependent hydrolase
MTQLPPGSCDCHVHVVGPQAQYPMVPERHYTPPPASVDDLRAHMQGVGLMRAVIVQPSFYGFDNRCLLDSVRELGSSGRGVAVVDESVSDDELRSMSAQGVKGIRFNLESIGVRDPRSMLAGLARWGERLAPLGWHIQIYASLGAIAKAARQLGALPVPFVLDHFAMVPSSSQDGDARIDIVMALVRSGKAFVKLSAPYRIGAQTPESQAAVARLAAEYLGANPDRMLWGSDWPHTQREAGRSPHEVSAYRQVSSSELAQGIEAWLPRAELRERVLVKNPQALYRFDES